jgi:hypothetical protein
LKFGIRDVCDITMKRSEDDVAVLRGKNILNESFNLEKNPLTIKIEEGLKIEARESIYESLKNNPYIQNNFKLNVKRLNRWWYSIYFDKKE